MNLKNKMSRAAVYAATALSSLSSLSAFAQRAPQQDIENRQHKTEMIASDAKQQNADNQEARYRAMARYIYYLEFTRKAQELDNKIAANTNAMQDMSPEEKAAVQKQIEQDQKKLRTYTNRINILKALDKNGPFAKIKLFTTDARAEYNNYVSNKNNQKRLSTMIQRELSSGRVDYDKNMVLISDCYDSATANQIYVLSESDCYHPKNLEKSNETFLPAEFKGLSQDQAQSLLLHYQDVYRAQEANAMMQGGNSDDSYFGFKSLSGQQNQIISRVNSINKDRGLSPEWRGTAAEENSLEKYKDLRMIVVNRTYIQLSNTAAKGNTIQLNLQQNRGR